MTAAADDWTRDALCREPAYVDVVFFPGLGESTAAARAVCRRCLVRPECLAYALAADITDGIWGGHTPAERRDLARARAAPTRPGGKSSHLDTPRRP